MTLRYSKVSSTGCHLQIIHLFLCLLDFGYTSMCIMSIFVLLCNLLSLLENNTTSKKNMIYRTIHFSAETTKKSRYFANSQQLQRTQCIQQVECSTTRQSRPLNYLCSFKVCEQTTPLTTAVFFIKVDTVQIELQLVVKTLPCSHIGLPLKTNVDCLSKQVIYVFN